MSGPAHEQPIALGVRPKERETQLSRAYIESMMPAMYERLPEETFKRHLLTLAHAPEELFGPTSVDVQVMRLDEALTMYAAQAGRARRADCNTSSINVVKCDADYTIIAITDLQDGQVSFTAMPTVRGLDFAMYLLNLVMAALPKEEEEVAQQK